MPINLQQVIKIVKAIKKQQNIIMEIDIYIFIIKTLISINNSIYSIKKTLINTLF